MIFVKFPEPGKVKTRLAKSLGKEGAAEAYRRMVAKVAENVVPATGEELRWDIWVVFDPADREHDVREWLEPLFDSKPTKFLPQVSGGLGERLEAAFAAGFEAGFGKVAAIGTDCVDLDRAGVAECWQKLDSSDVVFGPADDGGYYLVGLKSACPKLFQQIPWSDERTLEVSKEVAAKLDLRVGELPVLSDVDEIEQWRAVESGL